MSRLLWCLLGLLFTVEIYAFVPTGQVQPSLILHGKGFGKTTKDKASGPDLSHLGPEWRGFKFAPGSSVRPYPQTPKRSVPAGIAKPDYFDDGVPKKTGSRMPWQIEVKSEQDIAGMVAAGKVARAVLDTAGAALKAGMTTEEIDVLVHNEAINRGAYPSPLGYQGFPKSVCTSLNEVICHGIPDETVLKDGDLINVDVTTYFQGYHGDCSETFVVGGASAADQAGLSLVQATYDCWVAAMDFCEPGRPYKEIGAVIEDFVTPLGFTSVKEFCGHGIGDIFHTNPNIMHYRNNEPNGVMAVGHTFTIEPMICEGSPKVLHWPDNWTATTTDGRRTAQFEHTLLMTESGVVPLTGKIPGVSPLYPWERGAPYAGRGSRAP